MNNRIRIAAQLQALIMAMAKGLGTITTSDIISHADAKVMGAQDHHVDQALKTLVKRGSLEKFRMGSGRNKFGFCIQKTLEPVTKGEVKIHEPEPVVIPTPTMENLKLTMNQDNGALTICFRNLSIEINVVGSMV